MDALVDTGAKTTVVSENLVKGRSSFAIQPPTLSWKGVDGASLPIVGELSLSVRYHENVVDLHGVVVMKDPVYPLILGIDWITASNAQIKAKDGKLMIEVPVREPEPSRKKEKTVVLESPQGSEEKENMFKEAAAEMRVFAAIIEDAELPHPSKNRVTQPPFLKPMRSGRIPKSSLGFIPAKVPQSNGASWMIKTVGSAMHNREWITPNCVLQEVGGLVNVPVINLGQTGFELGELDSS